MAKNEKIIQATITKQSCLIIDVLNKNLKKFMGLILAKLNIFLREMCEVIFEC